MDQFNVNIEELYMLIGEREVIKFKLGQKIAQLNLQINEMSDVITQLREEAKPKVDNG